MLRDDNKISRNEASDVARLQFLAKIGITSDAPGVVKIAELTSDPVQLQYEIEQKLRNQYAKGFIPNYKFNLFDPNSYATLDEKTFSIKKLLCNSLIEFCLTDITHILHVAYFLNHFNFVEKTNIKYDPPGMLDKFRNKHQGGNLGEILDEVSKKIRIIWENLNDLVNSKKITLDLKTAIYNSILAKSAEFETIIKFYNQHETITEKNRPGLGNVFHSERIRNCNNTLISEKEEEIKDKGILSEDDGNQIKQSMIKLKKQRMELNLIEIILTPMSTSDPLADGLINKLKINELIFYLVQNEIINDFEAQLLLAEKEFFLGWMLRVKDSKSVEHSASVMRSQECTEHYNNTDNYGYSNLLGNSELIKLIQGYVRDQHFISGETMAIWEEHTKDNLKGLAKLLEQNDWTTFAQFDEAKWLPHLEKVFNEKLVQPLSQLEQLRVAILKDSAYLKGGLFKKNDMVPELVYFANTLINIIKPLQEIQARYIAQLEAEENKCNATNKKIHT